jgi:membrane-bound ClpP family serine protease
LPDAADWRKGAALSTSGELFALESQRAAELGIVWQVVDNVEELNELFGFEQTPHVAEINWALELVEALASPPFAVTLLVVGFIGVYIELHTPGLGLGGFLAAVAFLLFFWSNFLHGTAEWLEILLFAAGVFFILMELLVLPGFGIFGLGGCMMIIISLVLASQTFILPRTASEIADLRRSLSIVAAAAVAIVAAALALRRYLPAAPIFRTLLLAPPEEDELIELGNREAVADFTHLVGQRGTALTPLLPSGKALVDGQRIDVIADGEVVERGQTIIVTAARGNRVLVRPVDA